MAAEAENALIGATILDPDSIRRILEVTTPGDFHDVRLGQIFEIAVAMHSRGEPIDLVTLTDQATSAGIHDAPRLAADALTQTPTAANAGHYARIVANDAIRRRMTIAGTRIAQLGQSEGDPGELMTAARQEWATLTERRNTTLQAAPLAQILEGKTEYDWLIPGLLERKDRLVLTGGEGAGKTTLVRQIILAAAAGLDPFTRRGIAPCRALVVDAENSETQWRRKAGLIARIAARRGSADPTQTVHITCVPRINLTNERDLSAVHNLIDQHTPDIVAIGPLYKLVPRAITSDDDAAPLIDALDSIRARDVALVMEAHAGHATDGAGERELRPRGSAALLGWPEFGMGLRITKDDPSQADLVRWRGERDERHWPTRLRRGDPGGWPWTPAEAWSPSGHQGWN